MEMSITRGLAELKLLDKKIIKAIKETAYANTAIGTKPVKGFKTNEEYIESVKAHYQSVQALIKRRDAIKSAIVKSNATTLVTIAGVEMTVAEAIEKKTSIVYEQELLKKLTYDYHTANNRAEAENEKVKARLDSLLEANFGKDAKTKEDEVEAISKPYLATNETKVVDPIGVRKEIEGLDQKISEFLSEVDFVLSESNTVTQISIPA